MRAMIVLREEYMRNIWEIYEKYMRNIWDSKKLENIISHNFKIHKKVPEMYILQNHA